MSTSTQIETTVDKAAEALAKAGAEGNQRVRMTILSDEDAEKLDRLRESIKVAMEGPRISAEECFEEVLEELYQEHPELRDEA